MMTDWQAGPELDAEIARKVFGAEEGYRLAFSTGIASAWLVVEEMRSRGWEVSLDGDAEGWRLELEHPTIGALWPTDASDTAPLAICRAALTVVKSQRQQALAELANESQELGLYE